mgnify:CR=1 FL=1
MPLISEKNACLFGSLFRNYLPLHPISQLKALIISVFITIQGFDKTMFREEITVEGQSRIVLTKTVPHEICKMDFCCITNKFLDFFCRKRQTYRRFECGWHGPGFQNPNHVKMVSVSFDEYQSIFEETIRKDQIVTPTCFVETKGEYSGLFKKYRLGRGFTNYLLDDNGVIIAKNISAAELSAYLN